MVVMHMEQTVDHWSITLIQDSLDFSLRTKEN